MACAACGRPEPSTPPGAVRTAESLRAVATALHVGEARYTAEVEAWRSFQPPVVEGGDPLIAVVRVSEGGVGGVPASLAVDTVWLVRGDEVATGIAREEQPRERGARTVEFVLRDGPRWPPGDSLDVIVALAGLGPSSLAVRAPRVTIARVH